MIFYNISSIFSCYHIAKLTEKNKNAKTNQKFLTKSKIILWMMKTTSNQFRNIVVRFLYLHLKNL